MNSNENSAMKARMHFRGAGRTALLTTSHLSTPSSAEESLRNNFYVQMNGGAIANSTQASVAAQEVMHQRQKEKEKELTLCWLRTNVPEFATGQQSNIPLFAYTQMPVAEIN